MPPTAFSPDYSTARERFRDAARQLGWELTSYPIDQTGLDGTALTIDTASSVAPSGAPTLLVSGGLHGVEGFFGSAVQCHLLERWRHGGAPAEPVRRVFVHALNPSGFVSLRRNDHQNIDPNRNFLLENQSYSGSPAGYAELDPLLNPPHAPSFDLFALRIAAVAARRGVSTLSQVVAGGQHEFPRGIFFGGFGPSLTMKVVSEHLTEWTHGSPRVLHLDLHTGLGRSAVCSLLTDDPPDDRQRTRLEQWCGEHAVRPWSGGRTVAYEARGGFCRWCLSRKHQGEYAFAYAEFGTYDPIRVLSGLRAENRAHHWTAPGSPASRRAKARLKELFCPASQVWRQTSLDRATRLIEHAIERIQ